MSHIRIIKGKLTEIVRGEYNMYAKENITFNSKKLVTETGVEKGVSYGKPKAPPETPMMYGPEPVLKGEVIFCNGFHSGVGGAVNAAFNVTIGMDDKPWYIPNGDNTHHHDEEIRTGDVESPVVPSDMDKDIMSSSDLLEAEGKPKEVYGLGFNWLTGIGVKKKIHLINRRLKSLKAIGMSIEIEIKL